MKKRVLSILLILGLMAGLLAGCQNGTSGGNSETEGDTGYAYDQEDNIIDDNYRNYYEIFVYSFCDSDGDGIGDLQGVIQKLDYIKDMGFNGIWMMPISPSPTYHKYDVTNYYEIDPQYGTMADFEKLVDECHKRGINVVIDFVVNHSSNSHPWFTQACEYLQNLEEGKEPNTTDCPYFGYYHFTKEKKDNTYYKVRGTDWYYEGAFWSGMPDLNYESQELRKEFEDICKFWVEKGVDGFRVDAAMHIAKGNRDENNSILNWLYTTCTAINPDFYMVSEVWTVIGTYEKYYESLTPSIFNFDASQSTGLIMNAGKGYMTAGDFIDKLISYDKRFSTYNPNYIDAVFLTNHDVPRLSEACVNNEKTMKMSMGLMSMMNGSIYVYYGDEIGLPGTSDKDENKRLPMIWSDRTDEGETVGPSGCTIPRPQFAGVEQQLKDENSLLNYFKRALQLRNENPEIARGEIKKIESLCTDQYGIMTKTYEGSTIAIAINNKNEDVQITLTDTELAEMNIRGYLTIDGSVITLEDGVLTLPAKSICILK
jgi:glycosidase